MTPVAPVASVVADLTALSAALGDPLAWSAVGAFSAGGLLRWRGAETAGRRVTAAAWVVFAAFWLSVFPTFAFEMHSIVEGVGSLAAVPICLHAATLTREGHPGLGTLSRAVAVMGLLYLPVETIPVVRQTLVEAVAVQAHAVMTAAGYDPLFSTGPDYGYHNRFVFPTGETHYSTYIVTACTGIGSIAVFGGLIAAVRAPLRRKLLAVVGSVSVIWVLNVLRNAFISVAYGRQWFQHDVLVGATTALTGETAGYTSFFVADRLLAQTLSVVALVVVTVGVLRVTPELVSTVETALYVAGRREVDVGEAIGVETPGGEQRRLTDGGRTADDAATTDARGGTETATGEDTTDAPGGTPPDESAGGRRRQ